MGLTIALFWLLAGGIVVLMVYQGLNSSVDLFSIRNIYLAGFVVYQIISPVSALRIDSYSGFRIVDPGKAGKWMLLFDYLFIILYLFSYHRLRISLWLAKKFTKGPATASDSILTGLAISIVIAALGVRMVAYAVPALGAIGTNTGIALVAAACAVTGWIWAARRVNPAVLSLVAFVLGVSFLVSLGGVYSRRPLISVLAGFAWGAYHRWARHLSPSQLLISATPLILIGGLVVSAFTAVRSHQSGATDAQATLQQMKGANFSKGTADLLGGQAVGSAALWILDSYPRDHKYDMLFSIKFMGYWWVPRVIWESKPEPLSKNVAHIAKLRGVNRDLITIPPGVIGYAGAEGGFIAVVVYALFFGQFTRFFDDLVRLNPGNPYVILPIGCSTGQFLGLARGDIAIFTNVAILGVVFSFLLIYFTSIGFGRSREPKGLEAWSQMPRP
ncbi:MAG: hypothetical protein C0485_11090 [Pirellula sp.]|nr:hypothetical protein [Pirellula sp.]